jgi:microcystin-dependent protein
MPLDYIQPQMTTGILKTANALSELAGGSATGYQNTGYGTLPVGVIMPFPGTTIPTGWLTCHGQSLSRSVYAELFAVIGTQYGSASGTTFNLPDLRGRVVAGRDNMGGTAADRLSEAILGENPASLGAAGGFEYIATVEASIAGNADVVSQDGSNLQPTIVLNYIIKANVNVVAVP